MHHFAWSRYLTTNDYLISVRLIKRGKIKNDCFLCLSIYANIGFFFYWWQILISSVYIRLSVCFYSRARSPGDHCLLSYLRKIFFILQFTSFQWCPSTGSLLGYTGRTSQIRFTLGSMNYLCHTATIQQSKSVILGT